MTDRPDSAGPDFEAAHSEAGSEADLEARSEAAFEEDFDAGSHADLAELLREAHDRPVLPDAVAGRLDDVLAGLVAARAEEHPTTGADVLPLRRRVWPKALVAAAAVVVLGGASVTALQQRDGHDAGTASKIASHDTAGGADARSAPTPPLSALSDGAASSARTGPTPESLSGAPSKASPLDERDSELRRDQSLPVLTTADFATGAKELASAPGVGLRTAPAPTDQRDSGAAAGSCAGPPISSAGTRVEQVVLDGEVAALVIGPETEGVVAVSAWTCDGSRELINARVRP